MHPETVFLCVFRHPAETAASIEKECLSERYLCDFNYSDARVLAVWKQMYAHILKIHMHSDRWLFIHHRQLLTAEGHQKVRHFTGADIDSDFADASLYRSRPVKVISEDIRSMYAKLCSLAGLENDRQ